MFVDVDLSQPGSKPLKAKTKTSKHKENVNTEKYSIEIMRELYPYYVKCRNELCVTKLLWLDPVLGGFESKSSRNNKKIKAMGLA